MTFQIAALPDEHFAPLFAADETGATRRRVAKGGEPCRVSLADATPGETLILTNYEHQQADTPFRASHAIYVREKAEQAHPGVDEVPDQLRKRTLSLRGFDADGMMIGADLADGTALEEGISILFADPAIAYLHLHFAKQGCYAARVDRT